MFRYLVLLAFILSTDSTRVSADNAEYWMSAADAAVKSRARSAPVLLHFSGFHCPHCVAMEQSVFSNTEIQQRLKKLCAVHLNRDVDLKLSQRYGITHVPADVVIHADGRVEKSVGRKTAAAYTAILDRLLAEQAATGERVAVVSRDGLRDSPMLTNRAPSSAKPDSVRPAKPDSPLSGNVGLQGYCPVSLLKSNVLIKGDPRISARWGGQIFYFATEQNRALFRKNPNACLPECDGCDPVVLAKQFKAVPGDPRLRVRFVNRVYLFRSEESKAAFLASPLRYSVIRSSARSFRKRNALKGL